MKTPEEIKKGLEDCGVLDGDCENCPYDDGAHLLCVDRLRKDSLAYIQQLERKLEEEHEMCEFYRAKDKRQGKIISKVSKALCGKENTTYDEFSQAVSQVKSRLAQAERERDAAVKVMRLVRTCENCKHCDKPSESYPCSLCAMDRKRSKPNWEWRGVCALNTKEE